MCGCKSKIGSMKMNTKGITSSLVDGALGVGGAILGKELGGMLITSMPTLDSDIIDGGKVLLGCFVPAFLPGKMAGFAKSVGLGLAVEGGLNLYNKYVGTPAVSGYHRGVGYPINSPGLAGGNSPGYPVGSSGLGGSTRRGVAGGV